MWTQLLYAHLLTSWNRAFGLFTVIQCHFGLWNLFNAPNLLKTNHLCCWPQMLCWFRHAQTCLVLIKTLEAWVLHGHRSDLNILYCICQHDDWLTNRARLILHTKVVCQQDWANVSSDLSPLMIRMQMSDYLGCCSEGGASVHGSHALSTELLGRRHVGFSTYMWL